MLVLIVVALVALGVRHVLEKKAERRAEQKREIAYQSAVLSYSERFRPGMTRKEVEDYLRAKNIGLQQMCCVGDSPKSVWDDLTKIGQESAPSVLQ